MKILLTGKNGQVGSALQRSLPELGDVIALDRSQLDLSQPDSIREAVRAAQPDVIVNAAAYTAVDQAESDEAAAFAVNRDGPAILAEEAAKRGALLVHFSTDYVFDGEKESPYVETDAPNPLSVYGRSKLLGENAIRTAGCRHLILRTSWVYAAAGKNFVLTMLRLARAGRPLRVVDDQIGAPTSNLMIAAACTDVISHALSATSLNGVFHMSARGETSWYRFAREIFREVGMDVALTPIRSSEYPSAARRPNNSILDNAVLERQFGLRLPPWEIGMREILAKIELQ